MYTISVEISKVYGTWDDYPLYNTGLQQSPAEHTINGETFPLEARFVHQASDSHLLVVVLIVVSETPHEGYGML